MIIEIMKILLLLLAAGVLTAQTPAGKAYEFHGKVTAVDAGSKSLTVAGEAVPGWMDAMTMSYQVDKESVLKEVKPGDHITATVYDGDYTLHNVHVVKGKPPASKKVVLSPG
jgi:Cu/Ag efflux protein CusF